MEGYEEKYYGCTSEDIPCFLQKDYNQKGTNQ
jgi:hypothetical protein